MGSNAPLTGAPCRACTERRRGWRAGRLTRELAPHLAVWQECPPMQEDGEVAPGNQKDPPGIDCAALRPLLAGKIAGADAPLRARLLSGGRSNLTYLIENAAGAWVLRRPPLGHVLPTAHDMAREFRILSALATSDVPVPQPLVLCEDQSVLGAPFYVMEYRRGIVVEAALPAGLAETHDDRRHLSEIVIDTLVRLHSIDWRERGLTGFGRPEGYLERQLARWRRQWTASQTRDLPEVERVLTLLEGARPTSGDATIVHGDFRLGNLMLAPLRPPGLVAVLDWEMATLGDPLADLGWLLIYWGEPGEVWLSGGLQDAMASTALPGFLTRRELAERYAQARGICVGATDFYEVFSLLKLAVIAEGIRARYLAGRTVGAGFSGFDATAPLIRRALDRASASADARLRP